MDKARIRDLEKLYSAALHEIDALEEQCATAEDEIYELIQDRMKIQAQAAAMREALESVRGIIECNVWDMTTPEEMLKWCVNALAPDAGRELLERLRRAEAQVSELHQLAQGEYGRQLGSLMGKVQSLEAELKKAEAERVEEYPHRAFCADSRCGWWMIGATEHCIDCTAYRFHQYLKANGMIREAE